MGAVLAGITAYFVQMFVGLNDASEYSNPWYLQAARLAAFALLAGGVVWIVGTATSTRLRSRK